MKIKQTEGQLDCTEGENIGDHSDEIELHLKDAESMEL